MWTGLLLAALATLPGASLAAPGGEAAPSDSQWHWPVSPVHVTAAFRAPETRYSAGHRGVDFEAAPGQGVAAPASGVVEFVGTVVDRKIVTVRVSASLRYSLEPVDAALLPGQRVRAGETIGTLGTGGHCATNCLHLGVRRGEAYVTPLQFFSLAPRIRLLPWDG